MPAQPELKRILPVLVGLGALAAFLPALGADLLAWDDYGNLRGNPAFGAPAWEYLRWAFTTLHNGPYQPLAWLSFGLDYAVWGLNPMGYHQTNLLVHAGSALVLYFCALRLLPQEDKARLPWAAAFAALFWAVHPLRVESVVWVTERRDVLMGFFYLLAILLYLRGEKRWKVVGIFCLSLLSKGLAFMLPLTLVCLDYYRERKLKLADKWPYLIPAALAVAVGVIGQGQSTDRLTLADHGLAARLGQSLYNLWFYAEKTLLPLGLTPLYQLPRPFPIMAPRFLLGALAGLCLAAAAWRRPAGRAAFAHYALTLAPVIGFFQAGPQLAADRFCYLAALPFSLLAGAALLKLPRSAAGPAAATVLLSCFGMTWNQTRVWENDETLWTRAVQLDPSSAIARANLGTALLERDRAGEAAEELSRAVELDQGSATAANNLASAYSALGRGAEAVLFYERALKLEPDNASIRFNLERARAALQPPRRPRKK